MARYDLLVIGGGINGLGIAAHASLCGLSVLLVEKGDFGGGTTAASSRLIHGGLRYLQYGELGLVAESLRERGALARFRPHRVRPIDLLIPHFPGDRLPPWKVRTGLALYNLLARDPLFAPPRYLSREWAREREPGLAAGLLGGAAYSDAQIEFPERLCIELRRELLDRGGEALNYTRVTTLLTKEGRVIGAGLHDELSGQEWDVEAALTINAAGPSVDAVNRLLPTPPPRLIGGTRGTHLLLPLRPEGPHHAMYAPAAKDGRPFFLLPWDGRLLVGTTDVPVESDGDAVTSEPWEIDYLLAETNRLFPNAGYARTDVQMTTVGVRPLPASSRSAGAITRRHFVVDHGRYGVAGLASIVGGKLTTFGSLADAAVGWALSARGNPATLIRVGSWRRDPVSGPGVDELAAGFEGLGVDPAVCRRLARVYGLAGAEVIDLCCAEPNLAQPAADGEPVIRAEVVYAVEREGARTLEDLARRRLMRLPPSEALVQGIRSFCRERGLDLV